MTSRAQWRRQIVELCEEFGWEIESEAKHMKLVKPGAKPVFCACTPSDHRALKNTRALLARITKGITNDA